MFRFLSFIVLSIFTLQGSAQILDSARFKSAKRDTLILVTQQDVDHYVLLRKITDTIGKKDSYVRIIINAKGFTSARITYDRALTFAEQNEKYRAIYEAPITAIDVADYLSIRKIIRDTIGKTTDYLKIIKSAKIRVAQGKYMGGLYKEIPYENALEEAEENLRLKSLVDKILVIKSERKMYLQKKGKTLKTYTIGLGPNPIGQKEREGDGKTPEGIYKLDYQKWETTTFHSFHISYPNEKDIARANAKKVIPGSFIMIHGTSKGIKKSKDWTNGCIALKNTDMEEFKNMVFLDTQIEIRK